MKKEAANFLLLDSPVSSIVSQPSQAGFIITYS